MLNAIELCDNKNSIHMLSTKLLIKKGWEIGNNSQ